MLFISTCTSRIGRCVEGGFTVNLYVSLTIGFDTIQLITNRFRECPTCKSASISDSQLPNLGNPIEQQIYNIQKDYLLAEMPKLH